MVFSTLIFISFIYIDSPQDVTHKQNKVFSYTAAGHVKPPPPSYPVAFIFHFICHASHSKDAKGSFHTFSYYAEMILVVRHFVGGDT